MKRRRRRAARLGFEFNRTAGFHPPGNLIIQGRQLSLLVLTKSGPSIFFYLPSLTMNTDLGFINGM